jgi:EAL domain-containing protein (putative c-di-GMP-specific phosphodiesterase class I)/FixJ family two-component response regulator
VHPLESLTSELIVTSNEIRILFVDDVPADVSVEQKELTRHGIDFAARTAVCETELITALADFKPDVILCDYTIPGFSGARALDTVRRLRPATPILMVSGSIPDDTAVECLNWGAIEYILKPNLHRLGPAVRRAVAESRQRQALDGRIDELAHYDLLEEPANLPHVQGRAGRLLEANLRDAIRGHELILNYQPQFDILSGRVCGVEALARWFPSGRAPVAPSVFIALAEQTGLIGALGGWALRTGCTTSAEWNRGRPHAPPVSVNVSAQQICEAFTAEIAEALESTGLPANQLELEVTESVLLSDLDLVPQCLAQWKRLGVRIALDDFGTGSMSLPYLTRVPIDRLKIDGSLVSGLTQGSKDTTIVRALISLGRELGFTVLAEGVETEEQLRMLRDIGCQQAQGYLLTPPTSASNARAMMDGRWGARRAAQVPPRTWQ